MSGYSLHTCEVVEVFANPEIAERFAGYGRGTPLSVLKLEGSQEEWEAKVGEWLGRDSQNRSVLLQHIRKAKSRGVDRVDVRLWSTDPYEVDTRWLRFCKVVDRSVSPTLN